MLTEALSSADVYSFPCSQSTNHMRLGNNGKHPKTERQLRGKRAEPSHISWLVIIVSNCMAFVVFPYLTSNQPVGSTIVTKIRKDDTVVPLDILFW
jgi:hypothetical protein